MNFPAKILLIGEHSVLHGSQSLSIPFKALGGQWRFGEQADLRLVALGKKLDRSIIDVDRFLSDCGKGLLFNSTIPIKYGLGSSGALTAALYKTYGIEQETNINELQGHLASIESIFHGKSSGTDALVSYCNTAIHSIAHKSKLLKQNPLEFFSGFIYLFDSKKERSAKTFIGLFGELVKQDKIDILKLNAICNHVIGDLLSSKMTATNFDNIKLLSQFQYDQLALLIPEHIQEVWAAGLKSDRYYFKLCGAGGGGYFLVFSHEPQDAIQDVKLIALNSNT